jgi:hypothetical protein
MNATLLKIRYEPAAKKASDIHFGSKKDEQGGGTYNTKLFNKSLH